MVKVVIIHGNGGSTSDHNWVPWLRDELKQKNIRVIAPTMPDNVEAKEFIWLPYMRNELKCDENTIIVGHSSGAVAAMRYAQQHKLLGSILVGACYTDLGMESERISGYYNKPWLWDNIKSNQKWIIQLASIDDPYIPIQEAHHIHKSLGSEYHEFSNQGHFQTQDIPSVLSLLLSKLPK